MASDSSTFCSFCHERLSSIHSMNLQFHGHYRSLMYSRTSLQTQQSFQVCRLPVNREHDIRMVFSLRELFLPDYLICFSFRNNVVFLSYKFCNGTIGKQHELFDEFIGILTFFQINTKRFSFSSRRKRTSTFSRQSLRL